MDRDTELKRVMLSINELNYGCHIRDLGDKDHLVVSRKGENGRLYAPWIWLSISSRGEWFFQIMDEVGFLIPRNSSVANVAVGVIKELNGCMEITQETIAKYSLKKINIFKDGIQLDVDYSQQESK